MAGDFNLPSIVWETNSIKINPVYGLSVNNHALQLIEKFQLKQVVNVPTRPISGNILDLLCIRPHAMLSKIYTETGISDHDIVIGELDLKDLIREYNPTVRSFRNYKKAPINLIATFLESSLPEFTELYIAKASVNDLWKKFMDIINHIQDILIPLSTVKMTNSKNPIWYNLHICKLIKECKVAFKLRLKSATNKNRYESLLLQLSEAKQRAEVAFFEGLNLNVNPAKSWKTVNKFLNRSTIIPGIKDIDGNINFDSFTKADLINSHFGKVFTSDFTDLGPPGLQSVLSSETSLGGFSLSLSSITNTINSFKSTAAGPDGVNIKTLKLLPGHFASFLFLIFNRSFDSSEIPDIWRAAVITPIPKPGVKSDPDNYRPISITCCSCKIFESLISTYIHRYLASENLLFPAQHGFRPGFSCETQLNAFWNDVTISANKGIQVDSVLLDFAKAFDKVPHSLLLKKLSNIGIEKKLIYWVKAFLTNRSQRVIVDGSLSNMVNVLSGVPQGSVIGPLLFIIFINDIAQGICSSIRLFADDCILYRPIASINDVALLQHDLLLIYKWCSSNGMPLNIKKCLSITFSLKSSQIIGLYLLGDKILSRVSSCKYLGVLFSSNLSWSEHINAIFNKANASLFAIQRSFRNCTRRTKELLYFSLVRSLLEYSSTLWDPHGSELEILLDKIQRRAARFVLSRFQQTDSVTDMLTVLKWEPLKTRRKIHRICCFYKVYFEFLGWKCLKPFLPPARFVGRSHHFKVFINNSKIDAYLNSFLQHTSTEWNELPVNIFGDGGIAPGFVAFKNGMKVLLSSNGVEVDCL
jgi:hypothetical protein